MADKHFFEVLTGSAWVMGSKVFDVTFALTCNVIIARVYGAETVGIVAIVYSFLLVASTFALFGSQVSIIRIIPEHLVKYSPSSAYKAYSKATILVFSIGFVIALGLYFFAKPLAGVLLPSGQLEHLLALASCFLSAYCVNVISNQALRGLKRVKLFALFQMLPNLFNLLLLLTLGSMSVDESVPVYALLISHLISGILSAITVQLVFRKDCSADDTVNSVSYKSLIELSLPMMFTFTMSMLMAQSGVIMLGFFRSEAEVGCFTIAVKLGTLTSFFLMVLNTIVGPKFSELYHRNEIDKLFKVAKQASILMLCWTGPVLVALLVFGREILSFFYGPEFLTAYGSLVLIVVGQLINSASGATGLFMNMTGEEKVFRNIVIGTALMSFLLNFVLIQRFGMFGAAISSMSGLIAWNAAVIWFQKMKYGKTTCAVL